MSDLFSSLSSAARGLQAQLYGMNVVGQNIANVNTPGYARRVVDFSAVPESYGGGVEITATRAIRDSLLERRLTQEVPNATREAAIADALSIVETEFGQSGASLDAALTRMFNAFASLAENPTSSIARNEVQLQSQSLAGAFNELAGRLEVARSDANAQILFTVDLVNSLATEIAQLNRSIGSIGPRDPAALAYVDQQSALVRQLSELVDIHVIPRQQGGVDISIGQGRPLVVADNTYALNATPVAPSGYVTLTSGEYNVTSEIAGGKIAGLLQVRDGHVPRYQTALDAAAYQTAEQVNLLHRAGFDLDGNAGLDLFTFSSALTGSAGAASAIGFNAAIAADANLVAAAGVPQVGDNQTARAISGLRDARVLNGGTKTLTDAWSELVYQVGRDAQSAADRRTLLHDVVRQVDALRDQIAGVSLDEEAVNLLKFQRAYEANARFFRAVDQSIDMLLDSLGR